MVETTEEQSGGQDEQQPGGIRGFLHKHGPTIGLVAFFLYVILLIIGVIAELFRIQPILDWWIFTPPRR